MVKHLRKIIAFKVLKLVYFDMKIYIFKNKKAAAPRPLTLSFAPGPHWGHSPDPHLSHVFI